MTIPVDRTAALRDTLVALLGSDGVVAHAEGRTFYATDVFAEGEAPILALRPRDTQALVRAAAACHAAGIGLVPRGGGMSYTGGYVADRGDVAAVDLRGMNRILAIDEGDMFAIVEAGVTWAQLHAALAPKGLRAAWWGPLSGVRATVGGSMAQNSLFWGSGRNAGSPDACLGLKVVTADGRLLPTGMFAVAGAKPFLRNYGPDLTGLFLGDTGAFGIKAEIALRLERIPAEVGFVSLEFDSHQAMTATIAEISRERLATEIVAFDPRLKAQRMKRASLAADVKALGGVLKSGGLAAAAKVAVAGRGYMDAVEWSAHFITEARDKPSLDAALKAIRAIGRANGGSEIDTSIPSVMHGTPFPAVNMMVGPAGERWLPIHMLLPWSLASEGIARVEALLAAHAEAMRAHGVETGILMSAVGGTAFVLEPVLYWPGPLLPVHRDSVEPSHFARLKTFADSPAATEVVMTLRRGLLDLALDLRAAHSQIGRTYPYRQALDAETWSLLEAIKQSLDPDRRMNPGSLGLN